MAIDPAILASRVSEAQAALHQLATGKMVRVVVDQNGERVEFTMVNIGTLRAYIADLMAQQTGADSLVRRPLRFLF